jgi:hypothetical protein
MTTGDLADMVKQTSSDTASQLTVLQSKGLVERTILNKGVAGGSTWQLTHLAQKILRER